MTVGPDTVLVQDEEPLPAEVDSEVVMLSIRAGAYFGLNNVGSEIWTMLARPIRVGDLCDALAARYALAPDAVAADVIPFLQRLLEHGLVRIVTAAGDAS